MATRPLRADPYTIDQAAERQRLAEEARERQLPLTSVNPDPNMQAVEQAARDQTPEQLAQRTQDFDLRVAQGQDARTDKRNAIIQGIAQIFSSGRAPLKLGATPVPRAAAELMQRRQAGDQQAARAFRDFQQAQAKVKAGREAEQYKASLGRVGKSQVALQAAAKEAGLPPEVSQNLSPDDATAWKLVNAGLMSQRRGGQAQDLEKLRTTNDEKLLRLKADLAKKRRGAGSGARGAKKAHQQNMLDQVAMATARQETEIYRMSNKNATAAEVAAFGAQRQATMLAIAQLDPKAVTGMQRDVSSVGARSAQRVEQKADDQRRGQLVPGYRKTGDQLYGKSEVEALRNTVSSGRAVVRASLQMKKLLASVSKADMVKAKAGLPIPALDKAKAIWGTMAAAVRAIEKTGVPSEMEMKAIADRFPEPVSVGAWLRGASAYSAAASVYKGLTRDTLRDAGYEIE